MKPPFDITNKMLNLIVLISQQVGRLEAEYDRQLHLRKDNRLRSIQSSLAIENNSLTLQQVTDIINGKRVLGNPKEIQEVKSAFDAYERILQLNPYSISDFLTTHGLMTHGLTDNSGHWRQGDIGIYDSTGNLIHMGARPQFVPQLMIDLFAWAKADDTPVLIKSAVMHYEIEVIHPFSDGNGRMGRLWQTVLLSSQNPVFAWLPIETIVYEHQAQYYAALGQADKANNSTVFIEFMLESILMMVSHYAKNNTTAINSSPPKQVTVLNKRYEMSDKTLIMSDKSYIVSDKSFLKSDKLQVMDDKPMGLSDKLSQLSQAEQQAYLLIVDFLNHHPEVSNSEVQTLVGKSAATVRRYLSAMVAQGLLVAIGERKARRYRLPTIAS